MEEINNTLVTDYLNHDIFNTTSDLAHFYDSLSFSSFGYIAGYIKGAVTNINSPIYSSIEGTIKSIDCILRNGNINDAISLIRKYDDAVITSVYVTLLQDDDNAKFANSIETGDVYDIYDNKVNKWVHAIRHDLKATRDKINSDTRTKDVNEILNKDSMITKLRQFCNNNVHYNSLRYFLWNNPNYNKAIGDNNRKKLLDMANEQLKCIFTFHLSNLIVINPEYLIASDYIDALDCGCTPVEGSQNWVAPYVQIMFDKYISANKELTNHLKECNFLEL